MARAIGETAPLIMIGMVAFVADVPDGFTTSSTVMPVQIYLWASSPDGGFVEKTAAGILVLLMLLLSMNAIAIYLRKRFEVRW
jgi:phosphate transport system permease protein